MQESKVIGILTAPSLAYFGESVIGRLRGVVSGEGVEGSHAEDISCILSSKLRMGVGGGIRSIVGSVRVCDIAH